MHYYVLDLVAIVPHPLRQPGSDIVAGLLKNYGVPVSSQEDFGQEFQQNTEKIIVFCVPNAIISPNTRGFHFSIAKSIPHKTSGEVSGVYENMCHGILVDMKTDAKYSRDYRFIAFGEYKDTKYHFTVLARAPDGAKVPILD